MQPPPAARKRSRGPIIATIAVVAAIVGAVVWVEAPVIWPKQPGPPVELLGINRTLTYNGSYTGYISGTIANGCPVCPLTIDAGTTAVVNASWLSTAPLTSNLHYVFVNWTIHSPYPFLAESWSPPDRPSVYAWHEMWEAGGAGGAEGLPLSIAIPFDSSGLPPTGYITEWINASAY